MIFFPVMMIRLIWNVDVDVDDSGFVRLDPSRLAFPAEEVEKLFGGKNVEGAGGVSGEDGVAGTGRRAPTLEPSPAPEDEEEIGGEDEEADGENC